MLFNYTHISRTWLQSIINLKSNMPPKLGYDMPITLDHWNRSIQSLQNLYVVFSGISDELSRIAERARPPVGTLYMQYPNAKTDEPELAPQELWRGSRWQQVSFEGAFFRATGGSAKTFSSRRQGYQLPPHRHRLSVRRGNSSAAGLTRRVSSIETHHDASRVSGSLIIRNQTIRCWQRVS